MEAKQSFITVDMDLKNPVELNDLVGFFGSMSTQFDRYMRAEHPDLVPEARFFVKEVRKGSIIFEMFPGGISDIVSMMDSVLIVLAFTDLVGKVILKYANGERKENATKAELKDFYNVVEALAKDDGGKVSLETVTYEKGVASRKVAFSFNANEARSAAKHIEEHKKELDRISHADRERVLMYFQRSDRGDAPIGKRSGERVVIEDISETDLALTYGSNMAEERIKDEIRNSVIYHRGFIVDVNVQTKGGRPVAYSVTHVHDVIDIED